MIGFPSSPTLAQEHSYNGKTWSWTSSGWKEVIASSGGDSFVFPGVSRIWADETPELMAHDFVMALIEKDYV